MATVANRLIELFRNLKSDAVPSQPRQANTEERNNEPNVETPSAPLNPENEDPDKSKNKDNDDEEIEEIIYGADDFVKEDKQKYERPSKTKEKKSDPKYPKDPKSKSKKKTGSFSSVNTQATGSVFNVVNSKGVQFGSNHVYYMSSGKKPDEQKEEDDNIYIEKDNLIVLLMESDEVPTHKYIDYVSKNLGLKWKSLFIAMGYLKGRIDTLTEEKGITEARYFLLTDWVNNEDGHLGRLATLLWEEGERQLVKHLSIIYKENKK